MKYYLMLYVSNNKNSFLDNIYPERISSSSHKNIVHNLLNAEWRNNNNGVFFISFDDKNQLYTYSIKNIKFFEEKECFYNKMVKEYNMFSNKTLLKFQYIQDQKIINKYIIKNEFDSQCLKTGINVFDKFIDSKFISIEKIPDIHFGNYLQYYFNDEFDENEEIESEKISFSINYKNDIKKQNKLHIIEKISSNPTLRQFFFNEIKATKSNNFIPIFIDNKFNSAQILAIESSINNYLTIIQGPPGTGKSTTIINIILSAIIYNKTVLVSTNNNLAVDGILKSLEKIGLNQFWWRFGNRDTMLEYIKNNKVISFTKKTKFKIDEIKTRTSKMIEKLKLKNQLDYFKIMMSQSLFLLKKIDQEILALDHRLNYDNLKLNIEFLNKYKWPSIFNSLFFIRKLKINKLHVKLKKNILVKNISEKLSRKTYLILIKNAKNVATYYKSFYKSKNNLKNMINDTKIVIDNIEKSNDYVNDLKNDSKYFRQVKNIINLKFSNQSIINDFLDSLNSFDDNQKLNFLKNGDNNNFRKYFPVTFSTNKSINKLPFKEYDYIIIDEAGQADIQSTLSLIAKGKNIILSGDIEQLEPIYGIKKNEEQEIAREWEIDREHRCYKNSVMKYLSKASLNDQNWFLNEHYRCDINISNFFNRYIYMQKLINKKKTSCINKIDILLSNGSNANNKVNKKEIKLIIEHLKNNKIELSDFGIITPFANQEKALTNAILKLYNINNKEKINFLDNIGTVHKFQGKEYKRIYFSSVLTGENDTLKQWELLNNKNLINVAVSRAKQEFYLVTNHKAISKKWGIKNPKGIYFLLYKYISEKKYDFNFSTIDDVNKNIDKKMIQQNKFIKNINFEFYNNNLKQFCRKNNFFITWNVFRRDFLDEKYSEKTLDMVLFNANGDVKLIFHNNEVIFYNCEINKNDFFINKIKQNPELQIKTRLLSHNELKFLHILISAYPKCLIIPNSSVKTIIDFNLFKKHLNSAYDKNVNRFELFHYDFIIYAKSFNGSEYIWEPIHVIELDDKTHYLIETKVRDNIKNTLSLKAGITIERYLTLDQIT